VEIKKLVSTACCLEAELEEGCRLKEFGTAVILCGGKSTRMGFDKCMIKVKNKYLIEIIGEKLEQIFENIFLATNDLEKIKGLKYQGVVDIIPDLGPVGAIYTALKASKSKYIFVTACDMPVIDLDYIKHMMEIIKNLDVDGVVSRHSSHIEPLYAFYSVNMIDAFENEIEKNNLRIFDVISRSKIHFVEYDIVEERCMDKDVFSNINYKTDLALLEKMIVEDELK
jgi:molybdenum cofactor guanylyltransferase